MKCLTILVHISSYGEKFGLITLILSDQVSNPHSILRNYHLSLKQNKNFRRKYLSTSITYTMKTPEERIMF